MIFKNARKTGCPYPVESVSIVTAPTAVAKREIAAGDSPARR